VLNYAPPVPSLTEDPGLVSIQETLLLTLSIKAPTLVKLNVEFKKKAKTALALTNVTEEETAVMITNPNVTLNTSMEALLLLTVPPLLPLPAKTPPMLLLSLSIITKTIMTPSKKL
jgi:hypothetical protein